MRVQARTVPRTGRSWLARLQSLLPVCIALAAWLVTARPVLAHGDEPHGPGPWWTHWSLEPGVIVLLAVTSLVYARGLRSMLRRPGQDGRLLRRRAWAFAAGTAVLALALLSPIDGLAGDLFWVHMVQHNLLMLAAAPLLVISVPLPQLLMGLPSIVRRGAGRLWASAGWLRGLWSTFTSPLAAWVITAVLLWAWHAPVLYTAAVVNDTVHIFQHISFVGSSLLFWWAALHTFAAQPANRGMGVLYLFTTALHSGLLGALLTFSTNLWVPAYAGRSETWGYTPLTDQQLAGTIMWVPAGLVYLAAALWMLRTWLESYAGDEQPVAAPPLPAREGGE